MATRQIGSVLLTGALILGACGADDESTDQGESQESGSSTAPASGSPTDDDEGGTTVVAGGIAGPTGGGEVVRSYPGDTYPPELTGIIELAMEDLAASAGSDAASVNVVEVHEMTWSDSSLGCPEPGRAYAQLVTDGLRIVLELGGETYDYRSSGVTTPRRCDPGQASVQKPESTTTIGIEEDGSVTVTTGSGSTTVTTSNDASSGSSDSMVTRENPDEDEPTEGNNPPDE